MKKITSDKNCYEIHQVRGSTFYIKSPILIPFYLVDQHHCILMDTGTEMMREKLIRTLDLAEIAPIGILGTHTHYDHFGNAGYLARKYSCPVALPLGEAEISRTLAGVKSHLFVFSAGQVAADQKMAAIPCAVDHVIRPKENDTFFCGIRFGVLHTPGHAIDHVSYITPDHVCYIGDALMCGHSLKMSKLPYAFNLGQSLETMKRLHNLSYSTVPYMIVAHRGVIEQSGFSDLIEENIQIMKREIETVSDLVDHPMNPDELCCTISEKMGIHVNTVEKAQNLERFLRPYMEYLIDRGSHKLCLQGASLCYAPV